LKTTETKLTPKQEQAIIALLNHPTTKAAGEASGVSETTLWRWLHLPDFQQRYRAARRHLVESSIGRLQQACGDAVETLASISKNTGEPASARVAAARTIIEQSLRAVELEDLAERVERLETLLEERESKKQWA
jgi:hypothetical protein